MRYREEINEFHNNLARDLLAKGYDATVTEYRDFISNKNVVNVRSDRKLESSVKRLTETRLKNFHDDPFKINFLYGPNRNIDDDFSDNGPMPKEIKGDFRLIASTKEDNRYSKMLDDLKSDRESLIRRLANLDEEIRRVEANANPESLAKRRYRPFSELLKEDIFNSTTLDGYLNPVKIKTKKPKPKHRQIDLGDDDEKKD